MIQSAVLKIFDQAQILVRSTFWATLSRLKEHNKNAGYDDLLLDLANRRSTWHISQHEKLI